MKESARGAVTFWKGRYDISFSHLLTQLALQKAFSSPLPECDFLQTKSGKQNMLKWEKCLFSRRSITGTEVVKLISTQAPSWPRWKNYHCTSSPPASGSCSLNSGGDLGWMTQEAPWRPLALCLCSLSPSLNPSRLEFQPELENTSDAIYLCLPCDLQTWEPRPRQWKTMWGWPREKGTELGLHPALGLSPSAHRKVPSPFAPLRYFWF